MSPLMIDIFNIEMNELKENLFKKYPDIAKAPITMEMPLMWGDMDSARHVNNLIYLRWTETARIMFFSKMMDTSFMGKQGPILGWQDCKYIYPMTYPDTALITVEVSEIRDDRFFMISKVYSLHHSQIAAVTNQSIIPYDYVSLKKIDLPIEWKSKLEELI